MFFACRHVNIAPGYRVFLFFSCFLDGCFADAPMQASVSEHELKQAYCNSVQALKDYITVSNLLSFDITGEHAQEPVP